MHSVQRFSLSLIFFLICITAHADKTTEPLEVTIYADDSYPPYSYVDDQKLKGLYTRILTTAFSRMPDYKVRLIPIPWKRGLLLLERGQGFALYPPYFHTAKRPYIWPYSLPLGDEKVVVYCHQDILLGKPRPQWPDDYMGLLIGINSGFLLGGERFWDAVAAGDIQIMEVRGNREGILTLSRKRVDCYMNDQLSIIIELEILKKSGEYWQGGVNTRIFQGTTITREQAFVGYTNTDNGRFAYKELFSKSLDTEIYNMRRSGELEEIVESFIEEMRPEQAK
ncbi:substrate-binding periplasmic protein [Aliamphritea ceti]|uniref:substrate-binding periplasmic protein n=1 Tax=Aliamphritea ceti TaxID=1524258 RepID=UPI0021C39E5D|nr:transporter substrate-binding domain-containing protein [Aliamphritea ceti]